MPHELLIMDWAVLVSVVSQNDQYILSVAGIIADGLTQVTEIEGRLVSQI
ncbi:hypothetical protein Thiowin_03776 [Thiorhodovibrio winogradskyi]|uniref:Uncharacterized protein n=1 Tax=Thiorhodovibrio winogradskyi TaxID=77007 RepID=A0ABZ0SEE5_9GAMM